MGLQWILDLEYFSKKKKRFALFKNFKVVKIVLDNQLLSILWKIMTKRVQYHLKVTTFNWI